MAKQSGKLKIPERNVYKFLDYIDAYAPNPSILIELGARDCTETAVMATYLPNTQVYSFECNPATLPICREVSKNFNNVHLIEKAVSNKTSKISFFAIDPKKTETTWEDGNPGASSLLVASGKYPIEKYVQKRIKVDSVRIDDFVKQSNLAEVDVLWMDIQGAELLALDGMGVYLDKVKLIHTEVEFLEIYTGQAMFEDVYRFLNNKGFAVLGFTNMGEFSADAIFINISSISSPIERRKVKLNEKRQLKKLRQNAHK